MNKGTAIGLVIVILSFIIGIYYNPMLPEDIPSHWNIEGEVDGYLPKFWGLFLMPIVSILLLGLFVAIPRIDPL